MLIDSFRNSKVAKLYVMDYGLFQVHSNGRIIGRGGQFKKKIAYCALRSGCCQLASPKG